MDLVGQRVAVQLNELFYDGTIDDFNAEDGKHFVIYDDGDRDWYQLAEMTYRLLEVDSSIAAMPIAESDELISSAPPDRPLESGVLDRSLVGARVELLWRGTAEGDVFFPGRVDDFRAADSMHYIVYDDGDADWYDLRGETFNLLSPPCLTSRPGTASSMGSALSDGSTVGEELGTPASPDTLPPDGVSERDRRVASRPSPLIHLGAGSPRTTDDSPHDSSARTLGESGDLLSPMPLAKPVAVGASRRSRRRNQMQRNRGADTGKQMHGGFESKASIAHLLVSEPMTPALRPPKRLINTPESGVFTALRDRRFKDESLDFSSMTIPDTPLTLTSPVSVREEATIPLDGILSADEAIDIARPTTPDWLTMTVSNPVAATSRLLSKDSVEDELIFDEEDGIPGLGAGHEKLKQRANDMTDAAAAVVDLDFTVTFDEVANQSEIVVGTISREEVVAQERAVESVRLQGMQAELELHMRRESAIAAKRAAMMLEVQGKEGVLRRRRRQDKKDCAVQSKGRMLELNKLFRKAEEKLTSAVSAQKTMVEDRLGELKASDGSLARYWRAEWRGIPQPVRLRIDSLRAVKDKLPRGKYALVSTCYDTLGGNPMHWTRRGAANHAKDFKSCTKPVEHRGRYHDVEMVFSDSIYQVCPSAVQIRPANCFVLELYQLANAACSYDRVVAWGVLPMVTPAFDIVTGKFKVPMLRGEVDPELDKYQEVMDSYSNDLDLWLGNLYLELFNIPRERFFKDGRIEREFDVRLAYTSRLLSVSRLAGQDNVEVAAEVAKSDAVAHAPTTPAAMEEKAAEPSLAIEPHVTESKTVASRLQSSFSGSSGRKRWRDGVDGDSAMVKTSTSVGPSSSAFDSSKLLLEEEASTHPVEGKAFNDYHFAVVTQDKLRDNIHTLRDNGQSKAAYLASELLNDLGFGQWLSFKFWLSVMILIGALWFRLYIHYLGQWLYLKSNRVPVFSIVALWYKVLVKYVEAGVSIPTAVGAVASGSLSTLLAFVVGIATVYSCQRAVGRSAVVMSKLTAFFGVAAMLDSAVVLVVDLIALQYSCEIREGCTVDLAVSSCKCVLGDSFLLARRFEETEGSSIAGVVITLILHISIFVAGMFILYIYLLFVHMNGRMLDVYRRLHSRPESFFVPHDFEVSVHEMRWVLHKAKQWLGPRGAQRKSVVCDYVLTDPLDELFQEVTSHLCIYTQQFNGDRMLYRHFLRLPDGTLLELFGDMDSAGLALGSQFSALQNLLLMQNPNVSRIERHEDVSSFLQTSTPLGLHSAGDAERPEVVKLESLLAK